jgi:hypothetical protein
MTASWATMCRACGACTGARSGCWRRSVSAPAGLGDTWVPATSIVWAMTASWATMCRAGGLRGVRTPTAGQRQHSYGSGRHRRRHPDRAGRAEHCVNRDGPCRRLTRSRILRRRSVLSFPGTIPSVGRGSQERPGAGRPCQPAGDDRCPASAFGRIAPAHAAPAHAAPAHAAPAHAAPAHAARASTCTPILANGGPSRHRHLPVAQRAGRLCPTPILWSRPRRLGARGRNPIGNLGPQALTRLGRTPSGLLR